MTGSKATQWNLEGGNAFQPALWAMLDECERAQCCTRADKAVILALAARVSADARPVALARLAKLESSPDARGTPTFNNVVNFLDRERRLEWKAIELKESLHAEGIDLDSKHFSNITNYLVRSGRFERLARGHYRDMAGNVFVTTGELPTWDIQKGGENED